MSLLVNLSEEGFLQIKRDRDALRERINTLKTELNQLQEMLDEFNLLYDKLNYLYERKITIKKIKYFKGDYYQGVIKLDYPIRTHIKISLGKITDFKDENDKNLIILAQKKTEEVLREKFPLYFQ